MAFELYNVVWSPYFNRNMDYFLSSSLEAHDGLLKRRSRDTAFTLGEVKPSLAAVVDVDDSDYDENY